MLILAETNGIRVLLPAIEAEAGGSHIQGKQRQHLVLRTTKEACFIYVRKATRTVGI